MVLGADPEFLIVDAKGKPQPAHRWFEAKQLDAKLFSAIFRDGYMVELNPYPSTCRAQLTFSVHDLLKTVKSKIPTDHRIISASSVEIDLEELLKGNPPEDVMFSGCRPSWNAYREEEDGMSLDLMSHPFRYAGGHIHFSDFSLLGTLKAEAFKLVRLWDLLVALPITWVFDEEEEFRRREFYGRAGDFRFKTYPYGAKGLEYRVFSSRIFNRTYLLSAVLGLMRTVFGMQDLLLPLLKKFSGEKVQQAINEGKGLEELWKEVGGASLEILNCCDARWPNDSQTMKMIISDGIPLLKKSKAVRNLCISKISTAYRMERVGGIGDFVGRFGQMNQRPRKS